MKSLVDEIKIKKNIVIYCNYCMTVSNVIAGLLTLQWADLRVMIKSDLQDEINRALGSNLPDDFYLKDDSKLNDENMYLIVDAVKYPSLTGKCHLIFISYPDIDFKLDRYHLDIGITPDSN